MSKASPLARGTVMCTKVSADVTLSGGPVMDGSGRHGCGKGKWLGWKEREREMYVSEKKILLLL